MRARARREDAREGETGGMMSTLEEHQRVLVRASYSFAYPDLAMTEAHAGGRTHKAGERRRVDA